MRMAIPNAAPAGAKRAMAAAPSIFADSAAAAAAAAGAPPAEVITSSRPKRTRTAAEQEAPPLVIPLRRDALDQRARDELLGAATSDPSLVIAQPDAPASDLPLLIANKLPGLREARDDRERFELNMRARPAELAPTDGAFDKVPVEQFGMAMLRGMGYTPDVGVGKGSHARSVAPYLLEGRPALLGLGAKPKEPDAAASGRRHQSSRAFITIGALVRITDGPYAVVVQTDGVPGLDAVRVRVDRREAGGGPERLQEVVCPRSALTLVPDPAALPQDHPGRALVLAHERQVRRDLQAAALPPSAQPPPAQPPPAQPRPSGAPPPRWLREGLVVKVVDEAHALFKQKCVVRAVDDAWTCVLETGQGQRVAGVRQDALQTVLPKPQGHVLVVAGARHGGESGVVVELDKARQRTLVRLEHHAVWLDYDAVCEYVGG
jgi:G patch domain/KOW motif-containing protein